MPHLKSQFCHQNAFNALTSSGTPLLYPSKYLLTRFLAIMQRVHIAFYHCLYAIPRQLSVLDLVNKFSTTAGGREKRK
jgi:hypothetical protein